ncbi:MAG: hypothetical protein E6I72_06130 [Chloroflexi bacterium]|nr:MAG: hypothetical protein E6I72_06130 [Chloroflexota bacterium]
MFKKFFRRAALGVTIAVVLLTLPAAVAPVSAAAPGTLYGVTRSQDLVTIDPATGAFAVLSNLFLSGALDSQTFNLVANPAAGKLYGNRMSFVNTSSGSVFQNELLTINASTCAVVNSVSSQPNTLVVDQSTGTLFAFDGFSLFRLNPGTGGTTKVATVNDSFGSFIWSLDIDPNAHIIYASREDISGATEDATTQIFTVNTTNGAVTTGPVLAHTVRQIVVDPGSGRLFGVTESFTHDFISIDPSTWSEKFVVALVPSADTSLGVNFGLAADGSTHTVFGDLETIDISTNDVSDQVISIQDETGDINMGPSFSDFIVSAGIAFAGPAPTINPDTLKAAVQSALASGAITKSGVAKNLLAELNDAQAARNRGQCKTAGNVYQQFINDVTAQAGKSIAPATASQLVSEAQFLMVNCP